MKPTALLKRIDAYLIQVRPVLLVLDTSADLFGGDEIDRAQVRQFIGILRALAIRHSCAVVLLSHPSVAGMDSGSGLSGSTAWNNSVRSRLYLERVKDGREERDPNIRRLTNKKSNYGPAGAEIMLRWGAGVFDQVSGGGQSLNAEAQATAERVFLKLLRDFTTRGQHVNPSGGLNYAPNVFSGLPDAEGLSKPALRKAMSALLAKGQIRIAEDGPPSRKRTFLAIVEE
jgi:RecA-family ATPase